MDGVKCKTPVEAVTSIGERAKKVESKESFVIDFTADVDDDLMRMNEMRAETNSRIQTSECYF